MDLTVRYFHFLSILAIAASLFFELLFIKPQMSKKELNKIAGIDGIYGLSAIILLATGFLQWFYYGKGQDFYSNNYIFIIKIVLAIIMGLISLPPTIFFLKNRGTNDNEMVDVPVYLKKLIIVELAILLLLPLLAVLMSRGIGFMP
jgi:putative membrane protein